MNATTTRGLTVWLRVHRKGRQPGRWLEDHFASGDKMQASIDDLKQIDSRVERVEVRRERPAEA